MEEDVVYRIGHERQRDDDEEPRSNASQAKVKEGHAGVQQSAHCEDDRYVSVTR